MNTFCDEADLRNYLEKHSQGNKMISSLNSLGQSSLKGGFIYIFSETCKSSHFRNIELRLDPLYPTFSTRRYMKLTKENFC